MSTVDLLTFSMRTEPPKPGSDWFRIENAKKSGDPTKVYIYDEIGFWGTSAKDFAALLDDIDTDKIEVHFNSPGGSVFDGLAIHATIKNHKATVTGIVDGLAASAASFILQACDIRQSTRNAQIMIHDAKAYAGGNAEQMRKAADTLDRISDNIADIYAVRSGQTKSAEEFRALMKAGDKWYSGNEASEDGLIDEVLDNPEEEEEDDTENHWTAEAVQEFVSRPAAQLAQDAKRVVINNRVEEAHMTGEDPNKKTATPPPTPQPPAPQASGTQPTPVPDPGTPAPQPNPEPQSGQEDSVLVPINGTGYTVPKVVGDHITALATFKKETIEGNRTSFVEALASPPQNKILATQVEGLKEFALSLSDEQFSKWKVSMETAPAQQLLGQHGITPGDNGAPKNGSGGDDETQKRIVILKEILQSHRDAGVSEEDLKKKPSWAELQQLLGTSAT